MTGRKVVPLVGATSEIAISVAGVRSDLLKYP